jgi:hypothetical protein
MSTINEPVKWAIRLAVYIVVLFAGYIASAVYADIRVRKTASQFCHHVYEGEDAKSIEQAATALGAQALEPSWVHQASNNTLTLNVAFTGLPPFDGYICRLSQRDYRIIRADFSEME